MASATRAPWWDSRPTPARLSSRTSCAQFLSINDNGLAVGYWQDVVGSQHGFLYNLNTHQYTFLDDPSEGAINGMQITQITGINDANEITGFYVDANGTPRGFYATPASATPEPGSVGMIAFGLAVLAWSRTRLRRAKRP